MLLRPIKGQALAIIHEVAVIRSPTPKDTPSKFTLSKDTTDTNKIHTHMHLLMWDLP